MGSSIRFRKGYTRKARRGSRFHGVAHVVTRRKFHPLILNAPKIVFLLGVVFTVVLIVMIAEGNRHGHLTGVAEYLSCMRVVGIGSRSGGFAEKAEWLLLPEISSPGCERHHRFALATS